VINNLRVFVARHGDGKTEGEYKKSHATIKTTVEGREMKKSDFFWRRDTVGPEITSGVPVRRGMNGKLDPEATF
jgi:hypothetical protein